MGIVGIYPLYYASFAAMVIGPILHVIFTVMTRGRYYTPLRTADQRTLEHQT